MMDSLAAAGSTPGADDVSSGYSQPRDSGLAQLVDDLVEHLQAHDRADRE